MTLLALESSVRSPYLMWVLIQRIFPVFKFSKYSFDFCVTEFVVAG